MRAATALRWLGHDVDNLRVAQYLGDWRSLYREVGPSYTEEVLVTRLFEQLGLEPGKTKSSMSPVCSPGRAIDRGCTPVLLKPCSR